MPLDAQRRYSAFGNPELTAVDMPASAYTSIKGLGSLAGLQLNLNVSPVAIVIGRKEEHASSGRLLRLRSECESCAGTSRDIRHTSLRGRRDTLDRSARF